MTFPTTQYGAVVLKQQELDGLYPILPDVLPLKDVDWSNPVYLSEMQNQTLWPLPRRSKLTTRKRQLNDLAQGDYDDFIEVENPLNMYESLVDQYQAILFNARPPRDLNDPIERMIYDALTFGTALYVNVGGVRIVPDFMTWDQLETGPNDFVWITPLYSDKHEVNAVMRVIGIEATGRIFAQRFAATAVGNQYQIDFTKEDTTARADDAAVWSRAKRGIVKNNFGTSQLQKVADVFIQLAQIEAIIDYVIQQNSDPILGVKGNAVDFDALGKRNAIPEMRKDASQDELDEAARKFKARKIAYFGDGTNSIDWLQYGGALTAQFQRRETLRQTYTQKTGDTVLETGDASEQPAGVAYARQRQGLMIRCRELQYDINNAIEIADGTETGWGFRDLEQNQENTDMNAGM